MSYSGGTSDLSSPDQPSLVYPERLIRPLPKRSIKSRLSVEAAETISYPPQLPSTALPTYSHYTENGDYLNDSKVHVHNGDYYDHEHDHDHDHDHEYLECDHDHDHEHDHYCHHHHHCHHDHDEDDDLESTDDTPIAHRHAYRTSPRSPRSQRHPRYANHVSRNSVSGPDGYEAFENTNNKKKRKIPTSGSLSLHHSLSTDLAHMGISDSRDGASDAQGHHGHVGSVSPTGNALRSRSARKIGARNPLGPSINGSNVRGGPSKYDQNMSTSAKAEETKQDQGIISAAIANATALLRKPLSKGQENVGILDQQAKPAPANSQFTFTCEADAKGVTFPEQSLYSPGYQQRNNGQLVAPGQKVSTQGTQTSPHVAQQPRQQMPAPHQNASAQQGQGKKPPRRRGDVYALAARQRRLQQEYSNLQHPPAPEDVWICEFCEYESIFGAPPRALIRQYEIKDRRERRRLAEKRRLLEKAKLKGRKGKKQTKNAAKAANHAAQQQSNQQHYDQQPLDQLDDDYLDDGYDDDPIPLPLSPPEVPAIPAMPGSYNAAGARASDDGGTQRVPVH